MADTVRLVVIMTAAPGRKAELQSIMEGYVKATREEPGCLEFVLHCSRDDDQVLIVTELWADEGALADHLRGPAVRSMQDKDMGSLVVARQLHHLLAVA